jgi:dienelactone hydrolase
MVKVWYPALITNQNNPGPWLEDIDVLGPAIADVLGLPSFALNHLELSSSHAHPGASIRSSSGKYPLILFSHGWKGFHAQNTYQTEDLASHGFIVIAPDHTFGAAAVVFPDGRVALNNPDALPAHRDISELEYKAAANRLVDQWASDFSFIIDYFSMVETNGISKELSEAIDFNRIGIMGHSTGGGAAIEFCSHDLRCKAGLTMDAYLTPVSESVLEIGLSQPFLYLFSETWSSVKNDQMFDRLYNNQSGPAYLATILGTAHFDFSDLPAFSPLAPYIGLKGPLDGKRTLTIIRDYSIAFLSKNFLGNYTTLLDGEHPDYPEVIFKHK